MEPEQQLIEKMNELETKLDDSTDSVQRMSWREMAIRLVKFDIEKVREQFIYDDALDSESGSIFKLFLTTGPSPPFISVKSSTSLILLLCRLLCTKQERVVFPLADFALEIIDMGANVLKSDDEGNSCIGVLSAHLRSKYPPSSCSNTLVYRTLLKLANRIADKCNANQRAAFDKYIEECREKNSNAEKDPYDFDNEFVTFEDLAFFLRKAHFYPESIRATLYTVFFFAKIDINEARDELGDDIIAHLARNKQLDKCSIDLAEHFDFDFLKNYRGDGKRHFLGKVLEVNTVPSETPCWSLIDLVHQNPKPNMKNRLLKAMEAQVKRQPEKNDAYQVVLKKLDEAKLEHEKQLVVEKQKKAEKEKEKEISELKQKVKLLEDSNMILAERLKTAEGKITELFSLVQKDTPSPKSTIPSRRTPGKH